MIEASSALGQTTPYAQPVHELLPRLSLGYNVGAAWESSADQPDRDAFLVYSLCSVSG